jgi:hypothetical protein
MSIPIKSSDIAETAESPENQPLRGLCLGSAVWEAFIGFINHFILHLFFRHPFLLHYYSSTRAPN